MPQENIYSLNIMLAKLIQRAADFSNRHSWGLLMSAMVLLAVIVVCLILYLTNRESFCKALPIKSHFQNLGPGGYRYETDTMTFVTRDDRNKAIEALALKLRKHNLVYSFGQLSNLRDPFIIMTLEPEDGTDETKLFGRIVIMVEPEYPLALAAVQAARKNRNMLASETERLVIYGLLIKYFKAIKQPLTVELPYWTDELLIQTIRTLQAPQSSAFSKATYSKGSTTTVAAPDASQTEADALLAAIPSNISTDSTVNQPLPTATAAATLEPQILPDTSIATTAVVDSTVNQPLPSAQ